MQPSCRRAASIPGVSDDERPRSSSRARLSCSIGEAVRRNYCSCAVGLHVEVCVSRAAATVQMSVTAGRARRLSLLRADVAAAAAFTCAERMG